MKKFREENWVGMNGQLADDEEGKFSRLALPRNAVSVELPLRERDMLLVACHEQSIGKSSSLNTILPFLRVAGDPLWSLVTVLGICKILEYKT
ncbi:hypothetical protein D5086_013813 [Populus alba]|uniref:Uncharacterized protein n=1 Tax=Populus alba TaxID=43335 RepID=A0ACC4C779_POPAL